MARLARKSSTASTKAGIELISERVKLKESWHPPVQPHPNKKARPIKKARRCDTPGPLKMQSLENWLRGDSLAAKSHESHDAHSEKSECARLRNVD
jgi:hypothetical protein